MSFDLLLDVRRWRTHLDTCWKSEPLTVPVVKGNGYGLGRDRLAGEAGRLGADVLAVGTEFEVAAALEHFCGDVQVLTPWRPGSNPSADPRVIHTVSRVEDLEGLTTQVPGARVLLELKTSMARFGMDGSQLNSAKDALGSLVLEGVAIHLPMSSHNLGEAHRLITSVVAAELSTENVFVSHLTSGELAALRAEQPGLVIRPRTGTSLWLGDLEAMRAVGTVLDSHPVERGQKVGYRQDSVGRSGTILVVAGGTSHGIGMEAPRHAGSMSERGKVFAKGGLAAAGWTRSPFWIEGRQRPFVEPPHMQASMVFVPSGSKVPAVGERLAAAVRWTTTSFDRVIDTSDESS